MPDTNPKPAKMPTFVALQLRLDRTNYFYWRLQVLSTAQAHGFDELLHCTEESVPRLMDTDGNIVPEAQTWHRRDQFLMSWILSTISEAMLGYVSRCTHAFQVWKIFDDLFRSQSKARVMTLRFELQTLKKGSLSIDEYMLKMKSLADGLHAAGYVLSDDDLIMHILSGLGPEFDAVVVNLTTRSDSISLSEVQSMLHMHEMRILQANTAYTSSVGVLPSANYASTDKSGNTNTSGGGNKSNKGKYYGKQKVICQICGKSNHIAVKCFKRFDASFQGLEPTPNVSNSSHPLPQANFIHSTYQTQPLTPSQSYFPFTQNTFSQPTPSFHPQANYIQPSHSSGLPSAPPNFSQNTSSKHVTNMLASVPSTSQGGQGDWFIDSGDTHHVTSNLQNLQLQVPYQGSDHKQSSSEGNS